MIQNLVNDNGNFAANQFVIEGSYGTYFQSYESIICLYRHGVLYISPKWDYSNTTRKHLYIFIRKYTNFRASNKKEVLERIKEGQFIEMEEQYITPSIV